MSAPSPSMSVGAADRCTLTLCNRARVANIVSNAVRHTERGGAITITATERDGSSPSFFGGRSGSGIPPDSATHLRQVCQVPNAPPAAPGWALPLRNILLKPMRPDECASEMGHGTTFTFTLRRLSVPQTDTAGQDTGGKRKV